MSSLTYRGFEDSSLTDFDHWVRSGTRVLRWSDDFLKYSETDGPFSYSMTVELDGLTGEVTYREKLIWTEMVMKEFKSFLRMVLNGITG